ncbi:transcriptional regulator, TetR family [Peptostreptococcaceae bacterium oral taxon 113 str. W5053]|nr:transcriptional regulator, TetR family [Peptostreptococcaceae bacterium oral taxon 113 str. W5053]
MQWLKESEYLLNPPKTKRGWDTLEKICKAAEREFSEKGFSNVSVVDITQSAQIAAGTFYIYFDSKLAMYKYLLKSYYHDIRMNIQKQVEGVSSREEQEAIGLRYWFDYVDKHHFVFNIAWESFFIDKELFDEYYTSFGQAYSSRLQRAQENGEVRDIDLEVLSFSLIGISNFLALHWVVFKKKNHYDYVRDEAMKLLREGMFINHK